MPLYPPIRLELVGSVLFPPGTQDLYPVVTPILQKKPDMIELGGTPQPSGAVVKAVRELGFTGPLHTMGLLPEYLMEIAGEKNVYGIYLVSNQLQDWEWEGLTDEYKCPQKFIDWHKATGESELRYADIIPSGYDAPWIWQQAVEKAQSLDPDKIAKALRTYEFESCYGIKRKFYGKGRLGIDSAMPAALFISEMVGDKLKLISKVSPPEKLLP